MICANCAKLAVFFLEKNCQSCNKKITINLTKICESCSANKNLCAICLKNIFNKSNIRNCNSCGKK